MKIRRVDLGREKSGITDYILRGLPEWFGIEESIVEYINGVRETDVYIAYDIDNPVGFISIKQNNKYTAEIYLIGVLKECHNSGIGRCLVYKAIEVVKNKGVKFLMVKTLGESHPDKNYKKTRKFYESMDFYPLEEIKEIWGEDNPCLIMAKYIERNLS